MLQYITVGWIDVSEKSKDYDDPASPAQIIFSLSIQTDFSWVLHYCGKEVDTKTYAMS